MRAMNRCFQIGIAVILLITSAQPQESLSVMVESELKEKANHAAPASTSELNNVSAIAAAEKRQPTAKGLRITILFKNSGTTTIRFLDPTDTTSLEILTEEGWPLEVPRKPPAALLNVRGNVGSGRPVVLTAGQTFTLELAVERVKKPARKAEGVNDAGMPKIELITGGNYRVRVTSTLIALSEAASDAPRNRTLVSDYVIISLIS